MKTIIEYLINNHIQHLKDEHRIDISSYKDLQNGCYWAVVTENGRAFGKLLDKNNNIKSFEPNAYYSHLFYVDMDDFVQYESGFLSNFLVSADVNYYKFDTITDEEYELAQEIEEHINTYKYRLTEKSIIGKVKNNTFIPDIN